MHGYVKAIHIIGAVSWFAGLLYLVRLFVYHAEAAARPEPERTVLTRSLALMERRLWYGITVPAMAVTLGFGLWLMAMLRAWELPWFQVKAGLLLALLGYHAVCGRLRRRLERDEAIAPARLRAFNEGGTLFLVAIVCVASTRDPMGALWGSLGFLGLAAAIMAAIRIKRARSL